MLPPPSGFESYFGTNHAASDTEAASIKKLLDKLTPEVAWLDAQIKSLMKRREALSMYIEEHRVLASHIRSLPSYILSIIFLQCLPTKGNALVTAHEAPLLLTQVCRRWRDLSLRTPLLWANIHLSLPYNPAVLPGQELGDANWRRRLRGRAKLLEVWLSRSQPCPLRLSVAEGFGSYGTPFADNGKEAEDVIKSILQHRARWRSLDIQTTPSLARTLLSLDPSQTPNLRDLDLKLHVYPSYNGVVPSDMGPDFTLSTLSTPSLRKLRLRDLPREISQFLVRWETLTVLKIDTSDFGSFGSPHFDAHWAIHILEKTRDLEECSFTFRPSSRPLWAVVLLPPKSKKSGRIVLANLHRLEVGPMSLVAPQFVERLELPSLKTLKFSPAYTASTAMLTYSSPTSPLLLAMRQWGRSITSMEFDCGNITTEDLQEFLRIADDIEELSVFSRSQRSVSPLQPYYEGCAAFDEEALAAITPSEDLLEESNGILLPKLSSFHFGITSPEFDVRSLTKFIRARRSPIAHAKGLALLEHLEIFFGFERPFDNIVPEDAVLLHLTEDDRLNLNGFTVETGWRSCRKPQYNQIDHTAQLWDPALGSRDTDDWSRHSEPQHCDGPSCRRCALLP
ncbi:hypothetical protein BKA70DRAFT_1257122 [Coprinopsis sp. MPI-PUGE-AT-0042]|nr:hypothetical protein BKA70DRAFT_1257122 [Coprinopsis sp. MPI-PUGE-AT-0042]